MLDAELLGHGDLDVVDVAAVPDGLEDGVAEAQRQDVLHRLFAQVVVDAEDLVLVERRRAAWRRGPGRCRGRGRRASPPRCGRRSRRSPGTLQPCSARALGHVAEHRRDGGEVVARGSRRCRAWRRRRRGPSSACRRWASRRTRPTRSGTGRRRFFHSGPASGTASRAAWRNWSSLHCGAGHPDHGEAVGEGLVLGQRGDGGQELARRQVARGAEDDQGQRGRRVAPTSRAWAVSSTGSWSSMSTPSIATGVASVVTTPSLSTSAWTSTPASTSTPTWAAPCACLAPPDGRTR